MQCEQVKFRSKKKVKINVRHSVVAVGTVEVCVCVPGGGGRGVTVLRRSKWKVEPIPILSLGYAFLIRNRYQFIVGLKKSFPVVG